MSGRYAERNDQGGSALQQWLWVGCKLLRLPIVGAPLAIVLKSGEEADTRFNVLSVEQVKSGSVMN